MSNLDQRAIEEAHQLGIWVGHRWNQLWRIKAMQERKEELKLAAEMEEYEAAQEEYYSRYT